MTDVFAPEVRVEWFVRCRFYAFTDGGLEVLADFFRSIPNASWIWTWDLPAFQCRNISIRSFTVNDFLATSISFHKPLAGLISGAKPSSTRTPNRHTPGWVPLYLSSGTETFLR